MDILVGLASPLWHWAVQGIVLIPYPGLVQEYQRNLEFEPPSFLSTLECNSVFLIPELERQRQKDCQSLLVSLARVTS